MTSADPTPPPAGTPPTGVPPVTGAAVARGAASLPAPVLIAIVVTVIAWASAFIVIRGVGPHFEGGSLALIRLVVGAVLLGVIMIGRRWVAPTRREWLLIAGFGLAWFGLYNVALNIAEQTLDAGTTAMLVNIAPILIALGAGLFLGEGIPKWLAIGVGVAFVGVLLIGFGTSGGADGQGVGILWGLVAAVTYAIGVLLQKPALRRLPAAQVTFMGCAIGAVGCLPFAAQAVTDLQSAPVASIVGAVYLGAVPTALAFSTWAYALSRMPAGQLGVTTYVVPPLAILFGFLLLGEVPAPLAIVGGAICLGGVALSRRR
ncbi:DMT family transporter [Marisediminicola senii]|uniref:DMT family transporter n=1 Tax=Marisediminicola senii TaxID=2711233 RepID=UPI0013E9F420|nr:DMT family transporter [Marisediminicola senii]